MAIVSNNNSPRTVYYQMSTTNKSFLEMHYYLRDIGIERNKFMLTLLDPDLASIDPYDPKLNPIMKSKVLRECIYNPWYFFREIVRIPDSGSATGVKFELNRGNLALLFCTMLNLNTYIEMPRQTGKTVGALVWYLYLFNFGTANAEINFLNKKLDDSKLNLQRLRDMRKLLPSYLRMDQAFNPDGSRIRGKDNVESLEHPTNKNKIRTVASARNKVAATSLLRGRTTHLIHIDEHAFIQYNGIIYLNMIPAFKTAALNAQRNRSPYGIIISTTPGDLTTDEGIESFNMKEAATEFSERWYDLSSQEIYDIINSNHNSNFVHIRFTYQQLGKSEQWFRDICVEMLNKWPLIRREVLLEWAISSDNSPFRVEDLETIKSLLKQPQNTVLLLRKYELKIYDKVNLKYPPIMGVDVAGGSQRDSSAITVIDSYTTKVTAELNSNFISQPELANVIHYIVSQWMPNCVVNIEANGGFGKAVIARLLQSSIKKNLFYTIKDKVIEERFDQGIRSQKRMQKTKVYGSDSTKGERERLMEIMMDRVEYHKDKIISPTIYEELCGLEIKKNGKIEHSNNTHDDQVFSWLWALYVYYEGGDLMRNWGIQRRVLKTDVDLEEPIYDIQENQTPILDELGREEYPEIDEQLDILSKQTKKLLYEDWLKSEEFKDNEALKKLLSNPSIRNSLTDKYALLINKSSEEGFTTLPAEVFNDVDFEQERRVDTVLTGNMSQYW